MNLQIYFSVSLGLPGWQYASRQPILSPILDL